MPKNDLGQPYISCKLCIVIKKFTGQNENIMKNTAFFPCQKIALVVLFLGLFSLSTRAQLSGTYTIDKSKAASSTNYTSFNDADSDLTYGSRANGAAANGKGVSGAVVFKIADGTYQEQVRIPYITGSSSTNTITFESASNDSSKVILTWPAYYKGGNYTLELDSVSNLIIKGITVKRTSNNSYTLAVVIRLKSFLSNITFSNNRLIGINYSSASDSSDIIYGSQSYFPNGNLINVKYINNHFWYGYYAIYNANPSANYPNRNITVSSNIFDSIVYTGAYIRGDSGLILYGNMFRSHNSYGAVGFSIANFKNPVITNNKIYSNDNGMLFYSNGTYKTHGIISNNFIVSTGAAGIEMGDNKNIDILHNTIVAKKWTFNLNNSSASSDSNYTIYNNILYGDYIYLVEYTLPMRLNNNCYYSRTSTIGNYAGNPAYTLSDWQGYTTEDSNTIVKKPTFTSSTDLHVSDTFLNHGKYFSSVPTDIDGQTRNTTNPTIGADEIAHKATSCMSGTYSIGGASGDYATFRSAVSDLKTYGVCGPVVFNIADGTYNEKVRIDSIVGSSATNTITFQSASHDSSKVIMSWPADTGIYSDYNNYVLLLENSSYITLKGISFERPHPVQNGAGARSIYLRGTHDVKILNNYFNGGKVVPYKYDYSYMIDGFGSHDILVSSNHFKNGYMGVALYDSTLGTLHLKGIVIENNIMDTSIAGISLTGISEARIRSNVFMSSDTFSSTQAIEIDNNGTGNPDSSNIIIEKNKIVYAGTGINWSGKGYCRISNNSIIILQRSYTGAAAMGLFSWDSTSTVDILNNSIYSISGQECLLMQKSPPSTNITNNIFSGTGYGIDISGSIPKMQSNAYHLPVSGYFIAAYNKTQYNSLSSWQTAIGTDSNSIVVNPMFASALNLTPANSSLNVGTPLSNIPDDINNVTRNTIHPTIGAYEIASTSSSTPPTARFSSASKACRGDSVKFKDSSTYTGIDSITTWAWNFGDGNTSSLQNPIHQYFHGGIFTTTLIVTTLSGGKDTISVSMLIDSTCVWPGDVNYDKVVDVRDILPIGVEYGTTGPQRANASIHWVGQPCRNWGDTISYGVDYKHGDCNGDSTINGSDTTAILANYSLTHYKKAGMYKGGPNDPVLSLQFSKDSFAAGDTAKADILLGTSAVPANGVYGFAFSLNMNPKLIDTNSLSINFASTWFTPDAKYITITKQFKGDGRIDMGITRIDKIPKSGYGKIGTMVIVIVDNIAGKRFVKQSLPLMFENVEIVDNHLHDIPFSANNDSVIVYQFKDGIDENEYVNENIHVYPNPAKDKINIETKEMNILSVKISDVLGKQMSFVKINGQSNCTLSTQNLKNGVYILEINTTKGTNKMRLIIQE